MDTGPEFNDRIISIVAEVAPQKFRDLTITQDTHLQRDLGIDSLMRTMLMVRLEQHFGVSVSDEMLGNLGNLRTVGDVIAAGRQIIGHTGA